MSNGRSDGTVIAAVVVGGTVVVDVRSGLSRIVVVVVRGTVV